MVRVFPADLADIKRAQKKPSEVGHFRGLSSSGSVITTVPLPFVRFCMIRRAGDYA
jgi:hypothetical protein